MSKLTIFIQPRCPHCVRALAYIDTLTSADSRLSALEIELVDELQQPALADSYDYYYVPTIYLGREKLHEGAITEARVAEILEYALKAV